MNQRNHLLDKYLQSLKSRIVFLRYIGYKQFLCIMMRFLSQGNGSALHVIPVGFAMNIGNTLLN